MSILTDLQEAVATRLREWPVFTKEPVIPVVTEHASDLLSVITQALASGPPGLCVIISTPKTSFGGDLGPNQATVTLSVMIHEAVAINQGDTGTKVPADELGLHIVAALNEFEAQGDGFTWTRLVMGELTQIDRAPLVVYELTATTMTVIRTRESGTTFGLTGEQD